MIGSPGTLVCPVLVGRDRELAEAHAYLTVALEGGGNPVLVAGEEGIGKSRLLTELLTSPQAVACAQVRAVCLRPDLDEPYALVMQFVRAAGGRLLGLPVDDADQVGRQTRRIEDALRTILDQLAGDRQLILVAEDLHWSDQASLEVLLALAQHPGRVVSAYSYRPEPASPALAGFLAELNRLRLAREIRLEPLGRTGIAQLIRGTLDTPAGIPGALLDDIVAATGGNPFLAEEILRSLVESGALAHVDGEWRYSRNSSAFVPRSLRQAIEVRLLPMGSDVIRTATLLAALGQAMSLDQLARISGGDETDLLAAVRVLVQGQLVVQRDDGTFTYRHALTRQAILARLLEPERRALHRRLVQALAADPASPPSLLAYHWSRAGEPVAAAPYALQAARRAAAFDAHREAISNFELVLEGGAESPAEIQAALGDHHAALGEYELALGHYEQARQLTAHLDDPVRAAELDLRTGDAYAHLHRWDEAQPHLATASATLPRSHPRRWRADLWLGVLAESRGQLQLAEAVLAGALAAPAVTEPIGRMAIEHALAVARGRRGDWEGAERAEAALLQAPALPLADWGAVAHDVLSNLGELASHRGQLEAARAHFVAALELAVKHRLLPAQMTARWLLAHIALSGLGRWHEARAELAEVQAFGAPALAEAARTFELWLDGHWEQALAAGLEDWRRVEASGDLALQPGAACRLADVLLALGRPQQALSLVRPILDRARAANARTFRVQLAPRALTALARLGDPTVGQLCDAELALANELGARPAAAMILRARAIAHRTAGRWADAFADSEAAARAFDAMAMAYESASALREAGLIRLARGRRGDREKATEYLERGRDLYVEIGATRDAESTDGILSAAGLIASIGRGPGPLSAREVDVAKLVAEGLSNREIASQLFIAEKTVAHHVGAILCKLRFGSRAEIAAHVARGGLRPQLGS